MNVVSQTDKRHSYTNNSNLLRQMLNASRQMNHFQWIFIRRKFCLLLEAQQSKLQPNGNVIGVHSISTKIPPRPPIRSTSPPEQQPLLTTQQQLQNNQQHHHNHQSSQQQHLENHSVQTIKGAPMSQVPQAAMNEMRVW